jgi:hypothetical protein
LRHFAIFLLIYQHILLISLHLHQKLLVLLLIKLIHVLFAFSLKFFAIIVHFIFFLACYLYTLLTPLSHKLLHLVISFIMLLVDILGVPVVTKLVVASWRATVLLLLKH